MNLLKILKKLDEVQSDNSDILTEINKILNNNQKLNNSNLKQKLNQQKEKIESIVTKLKNHQINTRNNEKKILDRSQIEAERGSKLSPQLKLGPLEMLKKNPNVQREIKRDIVRPGNLPDLAQRTTLGKTIKKRKRKGKSEVRKKGVKRKVEKAGLESKKNRQIKIVRRT